MTLTITSPVEPNATKANPWYVEIFVLEAHCTSFKAHPNTTKHARLTLMIPTTQPPFENYKGKYSMLITQYPLQTAIKDYSSFILDIWKWFECALIELISLASLKLRETRSDAVSDLLNKLHSSCLLALLLLNNSLSVYLNDYASTLFFRFLSMYILAFPRYSFADIM